MTLKTVAQKLVAIESFKAKIASGAINAAQNLSRPLLVPKMKIEASGRNTRGSIMNMSMPMLSGRTTSKPRTCRIDGATVLMCFVFCALYFVFCAVSVTTKNKTQKFKALFPLHLVAKHLFDY